MNNGIRDLALTISVMRLKFLPLAGLVLILVFTGCASPLDLARQDFATSLKVAAREHSRLKAWDAQHQANLVKTAEKKAAAKEALITYRKRRNTVLEQVHHTEDVLDIAADDLLIGDSLRATEVAAAARRSVLALQQAIRSLMEGR